METGSIINIALLVISSLVAVFSIAKALITSFKSENITITNKNTGKSVTISKHYNKEDSKKLMEFSE